MALKEARKIRLGNKVAGYSEPGKVEINKIVDETADLWPDLAHIINGEFHLVDGRHEDALVKCIETYLDHVEKKLLA